MNCLNKTTDSWSVSFPGRRILGILRTDLSHILPRTTCMWKQYCVSLTQYHVVKVRREAISYLNLKLEGEQFVEPNINTCDP